MAFLMGMGQVQGTGPRLMGPNKLYRNVHSGPRQGKEPETIVSYYAGPVPYSCPGLPSHFCSMRIIPSCFLNQNDFI